MHRPHLKLFFWLLIVAVVLPLAATHVFASGDAPPAEPAADMNYTPRDPGFDKLEAFKQQDVELNLEITPDSSSMAPDSDGASYVVRLTMLYRKLTQQNIGEITLWWTTPQGLRTEIPLRLVREGYWATKVTPGTEPGTHNLLVVAMFQDPATHRIGNIVEQSYTLDMPAVLLARNFERSINTGAPAEKVATPAAEVHLPAPPFSWGSVGLLTLGLNLLLIMGLGLGIGLIISLPAALRSKLDGSGDTPEKIAARNTAEMLRTSIATGKAPSSAADARRERLQHQATQSIQAPSAASQNAVAAAAAPFANEPAPAMKPSEEEASPAAPPDSPEIISANEAILAMEKTVDLAEEGETPAPPDSKPAEEDDGSLNDSPSLYENLMNQQTENESNPESQPDTALDAQEASPPAPEQAVAASEQELSALMGEAVDPDQQPASQPEVSSESVSNDDLSALFGSTAAKNAEKQEAIHALTEPTTPELISNNDLSALFDSAAAKNAAAIKATQGSVEKAAPEIISNDDLSALFAKTDAESQADESASILNNDDISSLFSRGAAGRK